MIYVKHLETRAKAKLVILVLLVEVPKIIYEKLRVWRGLILMVCVCVCYLAEWEKTLVHGRVHTIVNTETPISSIVDWISVISSCRWALYHCPNLASFCFVFCCRIFRSWMVTSNIRFTIFPLRSSWFWVLVPSILSPTFYHIQIFFPQIVDRVLSLHSFLSQSQCALSIETNIGEVLEHRE